MTNTRQDSEGWVPHDNRAALIGYYLAFFSFIPLTGILTSAAAIVMGRRGVRWAEAHDRLGQNHARFAVGAGVVFFILQTGFVIAPLLILH